LRSPASLVLAALWLAWCAYWLISARNVKVTRRRESPGSRALHIGPMFFAAVLMAVPQLPIGWLNGRFVPATAPIHALGVILVAAGLGFAVWARVHLGRNWSGDITLKQEHELVRSGPYALARHPIYSGMLVAMLGTAIAIGQWRGLVAFAFFAAAVLRRVSVEERWMGEIFPDAYARYRREVPALIPFPPYWRYRGEPHEQ
jgi:protein-S-isoprenylcysteine O-methyltransferase Ste14